ncbi:hypothetical protein BVC80_1835g537 [Macleaya cordata]|uniref:Uncharacterized protein n=1 Tax=Macleaya cordata TaxID=56857 RepID=A0A200R5X6_MACCD|nr:hypothetical protein BVC80_1835g537 [Macleaya cordata]
MKQNLTHPKNSRAGEDSFIRPCEKLSNSKDSVSEVRADENLERGSKMKLFPQPITSPSRLEKFPPPLMRSLRSNGRSKSRGRSRLSPMFIRNKKVNETQEPSSPKVTCFGQVRVRRSNNQTAKKKTTTRKNRYDWIQKPLFCKCFVGKPKTNKTSRSVWERWFVFFRMGCYHQRKVEENMEESVNIESRREVETEEYKDTVDDEEEIVAARVFTPTSPPKNALLLMRSRSENYRPSSLASLFWGSPAATEDDPTKEEKEEDNPRPRTEQTLKDSTGESRTDQEIEEKLGFCEEIESSRSSTTMKSTKLEDKLVKLRRGSDLPRVLRRSKSDPARRSGELDSENYFWKRRRLGFEEQYPHS